MRITLLKLPPEENPRFVKIGSHFENHFKNCEKQSIETAELLYSRKIQKQFEKNFASNLKTRTEKSYLTKKEICKLLELDIEYIDCLCSMNWIDCRNINGKECAERNQVELLKQALWWNVFHVESNAMIAGKVIPNKYLPAHFFIPGKEYSDFVANFAEIFKSKSGTPLSIEVNLETKQCCLVLN